jgi:hypothetical protein
VIRGHRRPEQRLELATGRPHVQDDKGGLALRRPAR